MASCSQARFQTRPKPVKALAKSPDARRVQGYSDIDIDKVDRNTERIEEALFPTDEASPAI